MNNYRFLLNNKMFKRALEAAEKEVYFKAFEYTNYNQSATAELLGISRGTFISKMKQGVLK